MPIPAGVETVTVTDGGVPFTGPDGTPLEGSLTVAGPDLATVAEDDYLFGGSARRWVRAGRFDPLPLVATDATGIDPTGFSYTIVFTPTYGTAWTRYFTLPKASPTVVLADILIPDPVAGSHAVLADASTLLAKAANLSDVADPAKARDGLGLVDMTPADAGLITWSYPPWAASSAGPGNSGIIYFMRCKIPAARPVTGVRLYQTAPGASLTAGQCLVGLYDSSGNRVAISSDQSTTWASGSQVNKDCAFTSQYAASPGYYWAAMLFVGSAGPSWSKGPPSGLMNAGWPSPPLPTLVSTGGQTSIPATVNLTSLSGTVSAFWAALY
ncbi:hypothetical protein [Streptomyces sp. NRRL S-455]|uniref:hypothetical protein n=1 Tax=Streptomyces sp. NRRL S-455 TaxID=1463908 RepID=UPI0004C096E9|nr:hypothetical protein [Streptomyces sp. NRRL S-455]